MLKNLLQIHSKQLWREQSQKQKGKIDNKIEHKITQSVPGTVPSKTKHTEIDGENSKEIPKFRYISPDKKQ